MQDEILPIGRIAPTGKHGWPRQYNASSLPAFAEHAGVFVDRARAAERMAAGVGHGIDEDARHLVEVIAFLAQEQQTRLRRDRELDLIIDRLPAARDNFIFTP